FGLVLNTGLPWVLAAAALATTLAGLAVALGGRKTVVLLAACLITLVGAGFIGYRYVTFAADHGASYDVIRAIDGFPPIAEADQTVTFATVDGVDLHAGLWLPEGAAAAQPASLPGVVFVHGGAFQGGGLGTRPTLLEALEKAGIVGIDVEYRLAPPPRWDQAPGDRDPGGRDRPLRPDRAVGGPRRPDPGRGSPGRAPGRPVRRPRLRRRAEQLRGAARRDPRPRLRSRLRRGPQPRDEVGQGRV